MTTPAAFRALIFDKAGNLYGTTEEGGPYNSFCGGACGIVYELTSLLSQWFVS